MRIIFIRHGESQNNIEMMKGRENYEERRTHEPKVSEVGLDASIRLGKELKELGIEFDKIFCSA